MVKRKQFEKLQQFHVSPKSAIAHVNKSITEPHGMLARDYQGKTAFKARKARKQPTPDYPSKSQTSSSSRKLYDIWLK